MVIVEELEVEDAQPTGEKAVKWDGPLAAVVITGAGTDAANGVYTPTDKVWHEAPIFENDQKCLLSREPHKNQKTGQTSFGWIIGQDRRPLYAIQSEALTPPSTGWRKFHGALPVPRLQPAASLGEAARLAGQTWKDQGNTLFAAKKYEEAEASWTRALGFLDNLPDEALQVALYSNRAEARLRLRQWGGALSDAEAALKLKPTHDKALLRAAVAAREMRQLDAARDFALRCLAATPGHFDAKKLLADLQSLTEEAGKDSSGKAKMAREKLHESLRQESAVGNFENIPETFAAKNQDKKKGFKAFAGYSEKRATPNERPALSSLPYHSMGLPQDQVELMDKFFTEMREKRDEAHESAKREDAGCIEQGPADAKATPLEKTPSPENETKPAQEPPVAQTERDAEARTGWGRSLPSRQPKSEHAALSQEPPPTAATAPERKQQPQHAKALPSGGAKETGRQDRRTARERQLDEEEARERRERDLGIQSELLLLKRHKKGEPTRFEQAGGELYCWWKLPPEVSGKDVQVRPSQGGFWLTVSVRGVVIFDSALFDQTRADDLVWSVDDGELHVTLTKGTRNQLWEQLGQVANIETDENGKALPETLPEPMTSKERIEKFQQMVTGDDGTQFNYEDLDRDGQQMVDALRRYQHARATGDNDALALAEMDLDEYGKMVI